MKAVITVGVSGSGKSYWATEEAKRIGAQVIERDIIRQSILFDSNSEYDDLSSNMWRYWDFKTGEDEVSKIVDSTISVCAENGTDIIISDTNLNTKYRNRLVDKLEKLSYTVELKYFPVDYSLAVKRDKIRQHAVGEQVIKDQWYRWLQLPRDKIEIPRYSKDISKPRAIVVDVDGTVARMDGRSPYDWSRVGEDHPISEIVDLVNRYASTHRIIFLSGRNEICREDTFGWLSDHFDNFILYMRPADRMDRDDFIKAEIFWNKIAEYYCVDLVIDDRPMVCRLWENLGLKLLNVGSYYKEF